MVNQDALRYASLRLGVQTVIDRLAKDPLIGRRINLLTDVEPVPGHAGLLRLNFLPPLRQNKPFEIRFATKIHLRLGRKLVLTGETAAIDGFCLDDGQAIQLKCIRNDNPNLPPGNVVDAVKDARQNAHNQGVGWRDIWVFVESPRTLNVIRQRWSQTGTEPMLSTFDVSDGTISKVMIYASDGDAELPLRLPSVPARLP
jgi:hypothetical protein